MCSSSTQYEHTAPTLTTDRECRAVIDPGVIGSSGSNKKGGVDESAWIYAIAGVLGLVVLLLIAVLFWQRQRRSDSMQVNEKGVSHGAESNKDGAGIVYDNVLASRGYQYFLPAHDAGRNMYMFETELDLPMESTYMGATPVSVQNSYRSGGGGGYAAVSALPIRGPEEGLILPTARSNGTAVSRMQVPPVHGGPDDYDEGPMMVETSRPANVRC